MIQQQNRTLDDDNNKDVFILRIYRQESTSQHFSGTVERVGDHMATTFNSVSELLTCLQDKSIDKKI